MKRKIVLENGIELHGKSFGSQKEVIAELVFNTSMVGYQEIFSDPSYTDQILCMTYPIIGNYGIIDDDYESKITGPKGLIVREYNDKPSNFRYTKTLSEYLEENDVAGISYIDTRYLVRIIRDNGSMLAIIVDEEVSKADALIKIKQYQVKSDQVARVSCKKIWYSRCANPKYNVVAIDCGIKYNIIRQLNSYHCNVTIVPYNTDVEKVLSLNPDGIFLSNGPGNPEDNQHLIKLIQKLQGNKPLFGICLGHQMIALANGYQTYKLKFGHHGGNHPVKNLDTNKIEITSQNHSYAVKPATNPNCRITHLNLLDETIEGLEVIDKACFSVQYHPESAPGPEDSHYLFDKFIKNMEMFKKGENHE